MKFIGQILCLTLILVGLSPQKSVASAKACLNVISVDRSLPWNADQIIRFGPRKGEALDSRRGSTKTLSTKVVRKLGLSEDPNYIYFYNYTSRNGKRVARLEKGSIVSAKFGIESWTQDGEVFFHSVILLKLDKKSPLKTYEQLPGGLGEKDSSREIILTISFQGLEGDPQVSLGGDQVIAYFVQDPDIRERRAKTKGIKTDFRKLDLSEEELQKLFESFLAKADDDGGRTPFDYCTNNCTGNLVEALLASLNEPPDFISKKRQEQSQSAQRVVKALKAYGLLER